jgi:hypothetical protein
MVEIQRDDIQNVYASLMAEVKARLASAQGQIRMIPKFKHDGVQATRVRGKAIGASDEPLREGQTEARP